MKKVSLTICSVFLMSMTGYLVAAEHNHSKSNVSNCSQRFETKNVHYTVYQGDSVHIADYLDGTRVISILSGAYKGYQEISQNGVHQTESRAVQWNKDHFVHLYEHGRVISYPDRQIAELY